MRKKVVVLGGGTGMSSLLRGLKEFPVDITAVVSVCDDGKSTGRLRREFNIPAVGDIRKVLVSLSETEPLVEQLLNYRFNTTSDLNGHTVGNLLLTAMGNMTGNMSDGIEAISKILNLQAVHYLIFKRMKKVNHLKSLNDVVGKETNPFVLELKGKMYLQPRANAVVAKGQAIVDTITGEVLEENVLIGRRKTVDKSQFAKIYASEIAMLFGLSKSAINVFLYLTKVMDFENKALFDYNKEFKKLNYKLSALEICMDYHV